MSVDPSSIPEHVVNAAWAVPNLAAECEEDIRDALACALAALMDDEPVTVTTVVTEVPAYVAPCDVLAAVLDRETDR